MKVEVVELNSSEMSDIDIISDIANDNKELEKILAAMNENVVLEMSVLIIAFENKVKKLFICAGLGDIKSFKELRKDYDKFSDLINKCVSNLEEVCKRFNDKKD